MSFDGRLNMYDRSCYDLAVMFLGDEDEIDTEENRKELAQAIQWVIEDKIAALGEYKVAIR